MPRSYRSRGRYLAYAVQGLILLNVGYSLWIWDIFLALVGMFGFFLTTVPYIVSRRAEICMPWEVNLLIALSLYLHVAGHISDYYVVFAPYYDKIAHFVSSITVSVLGFVLVLLVDRYSGLRLTRPMIVFFIVISTMGLGALWEIYEYLFDLIFATTLQHGLDDTMTDLIFDLFGAVIIAAVGNFYLRRLTKEEMTALFLKPGTKKEL
ncbi:MAG TPA: hypothetical protein ENN52_07725 [Methanofollis liminatans]|uniref:DUF2238 domain-containing protein n=1 Tax=Methanofollis liminatans TaxID=2201 RepID=A0A831PNA2_9EURY|nr:hypothetical protein [Methanofollis liminatans]